MIPEPDGVRDGAETASAVQRLAAIGLPPRPAGWVPDQPERSSLPVAQPSARSEPFVGAAPLTPTWSRIDRIRLAIVARLPDGAALRVERMSPKVFTAYVVGAIALVLAVIVGVHHHRAAQSFGSYSAPTGLPASTDPADATSDGSSIVVDVAGKVHHRGLVTLPVGARVADAVKAAGGALRRRDLTGVDLAQRVTDGELLTVGARHGRGSVGSGSTLVDLSTASLTRLETLPGVGPVTAQKIVAWRNAHGGFTSVSELQQVSGIGPARYAQLAPLVSP